MLLHALISVLESYITLDTIARMQISLIVSRKIVLNDASIHEFEWLKPREINDSLCTLAKKS